MAQTYLTRSVSTETNRKTMTFSFWCKPSRSTSGTAERMFSIGSGTAQFWIKFENDQLDIQSSNYALHLRTTRLFRDRSAWYHIVVAFDSTQATTSDRVKVYINGVQETSFSTNTIPAQNYNFIWNTVDTYNIGRYGSGDSEYFDGSMSHIHFTDGTAYAASAFGSQDATTGEWKINTSPSVTYGTNGFFILKDGNSVTDQSGNSNNWTVGGGTLTKTEDNPSSVFATLNPLDVHISHMVFSHGNNTVDNGSTAAKKAYARSTIGMSSGKFYFEAKNITNANYQSIGISDKPSPSDTTQLGDGAYDYSYQNDGGNKRNNSSSSSYGNSYTTNDIIGCAVDLDNLKIYFSKNGVWQNSGDPTSGATGTGAAFTITAPSSTNNGFYFFCVGDDTAANSSKWSANFGNGYFGTSAISSAGTNASNNGIFEYDVPTGYTALSTKGLNL